MSVADVAVEAAEAVLKHPEVVSAIFDALDGGMTSDELVELIKRATTAAVREKLAKDLAP